MASNLRLVEVAFVLLSLSLALLFCFAPRLPLTSAKIVFAMLLAAITITLGLCLDTERLRLPMKLFFPAIEIFFPAIQLVCFLLKLSPAVDALLLPFLRAFTVLLFVLVPGLATN